MALSVSATGKAVLQRGTVIVANDRHWTVNYLNRIGGCVAQW